MDLIDYPEYSELKGVAGIGLNYLDMSLDDGFSEVLDELLDIFSDNKIVFSTYLNSQDIGLRKKISALHQVSVNDIVITAGCDGALRSVFMCLDERSNILIPVPSFGRYEYHAKSVGAEVSFLEFSKFPYNFDVNLIISTLSQKNFDLVVLANPNNPTGALIPQDSLMDLFDFCEAEGIICLLDESLSEYAQVDNSSFIKKYQNLIVCKSFSKGYGLAGFRIGYLMTQEKLMKFVKNRLSPFEVSNLSVMAANHILARNDVVQKRINRVNDNLSLLFASVERDDIRFSNSLTSTVIIKKANESFDLHSALVRKGVKGVSGIKFRGISTASAVRVSIKDLESVKYLVQILNSKNLC